VHLTDNQQDFNTQMSKVRARVEWGFGKICQNFTFIDFKKTLRILLQPIEKYFLVATILTNCHTCLYGSLISHILIWIPHHWRCTCQMYKLFIKLCILQHNYANDLQTDTHTRLVIDIMLQIFKTTRKCPKSRLRK